MSDDKALRVAARAIDGFIERTAALERQLAEAQGKLDAVEKLKTEPLLDAQVRARLAAILKGEK